MKRFNHLWPEIISFENLLRAAQKAQKGKRFRDNVLLFNYNLENLENELLILQKELIDHTYHPGSYRTFQITDPKPRMISAAPYRDRVIHHALCHVIGPIFERTFINTSYANRIGFGTHRALKKFTHFLRSSQYILQCDIRKYFPSIDHQILKNQIRDKIKCLDTLWLIDSIIDASNEQDPVNDYFVGDDLLSPLMRRKGLPIGNLTSQFFANIYLTGFDHFVKEVLKTKKYLRYVDDFALFSDDHSFLADARLALERYLETLRLRIHPIKSQLFQTRHGANFVGFRVFPDRIRVRNDNLRRSRRRLKRLQSQHHRGRIPFKTVIGSLRSYEAHLNHGDTNRLRREIFNGLVFIPA